MSGELIVAYRRQLLSKPPYRQGSTDAAMRVSMVERNHFASLPHDAAPISPSRVVRIIAMLPFGRRLALRIWNRLLMAFSPRTVASTYFGAAIECDVRDMIQATIRHFGTWEPRISGELQGILRPGDVAVDVGANIGYYSLLFARLVGKEGAVVSVEAHPRIASILQSNLRRNGADNVRIVNAAASDGKGSTTLYEAPPTNIGMTTTRSQRGFLRIGDVQTLPLGEILTGAEMAKTRLIKIDVEGAETPIIRDLLGKLTMFPKLTAVAVEASVADNPEWETLFSRFLASGFRAYDLHNDYDWMTMLRFEDVPRSEVTALPSHQLDLLFLRTV